MSILSRGLFVVTGIIVGTTAINVFVFGNSADYGLPNRRLGAWREAEVRPACYAALEAPERDPLGPKMPPGRPRISVQDLHRAVDLTAALHCYVVVQGNAVCEPNNRAYIVDYIGRYFGAMDGMIETAARYSPADTRDVRDLWNSPNNRAITAALDNHIRNGRLVRSDFGWSAPAALKTRFETYAGAADICARERRWAAATVDVNRR